MLCSPDPGVQCLVWSESLSNSVSIYMLMGCCPLYKPGLHSDGNRYLKDQGRQSCTSLHRWFLHGQGHLGWQSGKLGAAISMEAWWIEGCQSPEKLNSVKDHISMNELFKHNWNAQCFLEVSHTLWFAHNEQCFFVQSTLALHVCCFQFMRKMNK